jgi:hypothetical protein
MITVGIGLIGHFSIKLIQEIIQKIKKRKEEMIKK